MLSRVYGVTWSMSIASVLRSLRPNHTLVLLSNCRQTLVEELLEALAAVCLGGENVAFGIGGDAMHGIKLPWLPAAIAEAGQDLHGFASDDIHLLVGAIGKVNVLLLRVLGECDIPHGPIAQRVLRHENFFHETAVRFEDLDAIVGAVANVEKAGMRKLGAVHRIAKLLGRWRGRIVA